ncbi:MAG: hypothetical protein E7676_07230 [Ruminococcaceae bacterium]|nr:hypothetical protein [Oscillospiraceae bacterium]
MKEKKPIKLDTIHWVLIAVASFALVLTLVLCLAFCGKDDDKGNGGAQDPGGTYDEDGGYTGEDGSLDPNWDVNFK